MRASLKLLLWVVGGLLAVLILALVLAATLFDPNDHRARIAELVEQQTGRSLAIDGDLSLRIFPWLAVEVGAVQLGNAEGFGPEPFARLDGASVGLRLLPLLLRREVVLGTVRVHGLRLELATDASGRGNWSDLAGATDAAPATEEAPDAGDDGLPIRSLDIAGIDIRDGALRYRDGATGAEHRLQDISLQTGRIGGTDSVPVAATASYVGQTASDAAPMSARFNADGRLLLDLAAQRLRLDDLVVALEADGEALPGGRQQLRLEGDLDYDGQAGTLALTDGRLRGAGLDATLALQAQALNTAPRFSGSLDSNEFSPRAVAATLGIELPETHDPEVLKKASLSLRVEGTGSRASIAPLQLRLDDSRLEGRIDVEDIASQRLRFELRLDAIDADRYLPREVAEATRPESDGEAGDVNAIEIPVELLDAVNAEGRIEIGSLKVQGLQLQDVSLQLSALAGQAKTQRLAARLYGGSIQLDNRISTGATPRYATQLSVDAVEAGGLLRDLLGKDLAAGTARLKLDITGQGRNIGAIRQSLGGTLSAALTDGAVKGINIAQTLRNAQATLTGQPLADNEPQVTDFASLTMSATIENGVLRSDDLDGRNPLLRLLGNGSIDLAGETLDYLARPSVVGTLTGQQGAGLEQLRGIEIPIRITGSWSDPKVRIDLAAALEQKAAERLREELRGREDELKERLRGKLNDDKLEGRIDDALGEGASKALRGLFGGSRRRE